jgi:hypothetical protein
VATAPPFTPTGRPVALSDYLVGSGEQMWLIADEDPELVCTFTITEPAKVSDGYGGWDTVARPQRRALSTWNGIGPVTVDVAGMFDGWSRGWSMEIWIRALEVMAGGPGGKGLKPPRLRAHSPLVPHMTDIASGNRWVITALSWGDLIRRAEPPHERLRQHFTLMLMLHVEADQLERVKPAKPKPAYKMIKARKGDTYAKIAARRWKLALLGRKLAKLNKSSNANKALPEGKLVRLPTDDLLAKWKRELKGGR